MKNAAEAIQCREKMWNWMKNYLLIKNHMINARLRLMRLREIRVFFNKHQNRWKTVAIWEIQKLRRSAYSMDGVCVSWIWVKFIWKTNLKWMRKRTGKDTHKFVTFSYWKFGKNVMKLFFRPVVQCYSIFSGIFLVVQIDRECQQRNCSTKWMNTHLTDVWAW